MNPDSCYQLVAAQVPFEEWQVFEQQLSHGFPGIPEHWRLSTEIRVRLKLKIQWHFFNPDKCGYLPEKAGRSWAFLNAFLSEGVRRKFYFLRSRLEGADLENWDREFCTFENLLLLSSMPEDIACQWLTQLDSKVRYGSNGKVRVIKNKGLALSSALLGVTPLMTWPEIKARFRFLIKKHHPDLGGDPQITQSLIREFKRLKAEAEAQKP